MPVPRREQARWALEIADTRQSSVAKLMSSLVANKKSSRLDTFLAPRDVPGSPTHQSGHADESTSAVEFKELHELDLRSDELAQLQVLDPGTRLEQGGVYLDLDDLGRGEFTPMGDQEAALGNRYSAKRDTDYELWNRLVDRARRPDDDGPSGSGEHSPRLSS